MNTNEINNRILSLAGWTPVHDDKNVHIAWNNPSLPPNSQRFPLAYCPMPAELVSDALFFAQKICQTPEQQEAFVRCLAESIGIPEINCCYDRLGVFFMLQASATDLCLAIIDAMNLE